MSNLWQRHNPNQYYLVPRACPQPLLLLLPHWKQLFAQGSTIDKENGPSILKVLEKESAPKPKLMHRSHVKPSEHSELSERQFSDQSWQSTTSPAPLMHRGVRHRHLQRELLRLVFHRNKGMLKLFGS